VGENRVGYSAERRDRDLADADKAEVERLVARMEAALDFEDKIRDKERDQQFDKEFIELARAVYVTNDERAAVKRVINTKLGSRIVEEKSYALSAVIGGQRAAEVRKARDGIRS
jgi:hypothetical protein